jgi:hypothetical protein
MCPVRNVTHVSGRSLAKKQRKVARRSFSEGGLAIVRQSYRESRRHQSNQTSVGGRSGRRRGVEGAEVESAEEVPAAGLAVTPLP